MPSRGAFAHVRNLKLQVQAAMTAVESGRGNLKEAERTRRGINMVDQQTYLKDAYLKDQLEWPPKVL